jgi:thiol-disulfide isomerase/thioredoxin
MRSRSLIHVIVVVALLGLLAAAALGLAACGSSPSAASTSSEVKFIPIGDLRVADYAGKPLIINYFASWCGPCNLEAPELSAFAKSHPGAQIVGVAVDDKEADVVGFMNKYGLTYPVAMDNGWDHANSEGVNGVPTTVFYNATGKEVNRIVGASTQAQFDLNYAKAK